MNFKKLEGPLNTSTNNHKAYARTHVQPDQNRQKYLKRGFRWLKKIY